MMVFLAIDRWLYNSASSLSRGYETFFMLSSVEHEQFSANKYENANKSLHFHIYQQRNFYALLCLPRKKM